MPTVSQKPAVNKRKSVGTIAYYFIEALDCPLPSNEAIAHAMRYIMPKRKGYNNPKREQYCHYLRE